MKRFFPILCTLFLAAGGALAHGNKKHILGTVEKINANSIVVKGKDGKSVETKIVAATIFVKGGQPAKLQDLAVGDRVVIHATPKGSTLEADKVEFATATSPPKKKAP